MRGTASALALLLACGAWSGCGRGDEPPAQAPQAESRDLPAPEEARMQELRALGYLQGSEPAPARTGVTRYVREAAQPGWNLAVSGHAPEAELFDMQGRVAHRWHRSFDEVWPGRSPIEGTRFHLYWRRAKLLPGGDLLAIFDGLGLVRLDRDSNVVWAWDGAAHHDLCVTGDGAIYVLSRRPRRIRGLDGPAWIAEDFVTILDMQGRVRNAISIYDAVARSPWSSWLSQTLPRGDIFHTNTLEVLDGRLAGLSPAWAAGNVLLSLHGIHALAVLDLREGRLVAGLRGSWRYQHEPSTLASGRILLFDNLGRLDRSRVLEIDPQSGDVLWSYETAEPGDFFSHCCGAAARLANGNTLVTESEKGRAFELDPDGRIVWDYWNPHSVPDPDGGEPRIATLFDVVRLDEEAGRF
jgi:hypothetical protein